MGGSSLFHDFTPRRFASLRARPLFLFLLALLLMSGCATPGNALNEQRETPGQVWLGTAKGVSIIQNGEWSALDASKGLPKPGVRALAVDQQAGTWIVHEGGVSRFQGNQWKHYSLQDLGYKYIEVIACHPKGSVWAGYFEGVLEYDGTQWRNHPRGEFGLDTVTTISDIAFDNGGTVWISTNAGVAAWDGSSWTHFDETSGLVSKSATCVEMDAAGRVWIGHGSGISMRDGGKWTSYGASGQGIDVKVADLSQVVDLAFDPTGCLWAVTWGNGVFQFDGNAWKRYDRAGSGLIGGRGKKIACDSAGAVWVGTDYELAVFDGAQWRTFTAATSGLLADGISAIVFVGSGNIQVPPAGKALPGSITGRLVTTDGAPITGVEVYVSWDLAWPLFFGSTPCKGKSYMAVSDSDGRFIIKDVPMGSYKIAIKRTEKGQSKWYTGGGIGGVPSMIKAVSGKDTYFGEMKLKAN